MNISKAKQRIAHELKEYLTVFLFVAPFFLSLEAYRGYLVHDVENRLFDYGTALFNALVLSKVLLTGRLAGLGKRSESKPLIISTIHKAGVFTGFYLVFHVMERTVRGLVHGQTFVGALDALAVAGKEELLVRALVLFFAFIPLFALLETRRVIGENRFQCLFLGGEPRSTQL